jgi:hypothetical protein
MKRSSNDLTPGEHALLHAVLDELNSQKASSDEVLTVMGIILVQAIEKLAPHDYEHRCRAVDKFADLLRLNIDQGPRD